MKNVVFFDVTRMPHGVTSQKTVFFNWSLIVAEPSKKFSAFCVPRQPFACSEEPIRGLRPQPVQTSAHANFLFSYSPL
jgi:hypothetical protein